MTANIKEQKHRLIDVIKRQKASRDVVDLFWQLVNRIDDSLRGNGKPVSFYVHSRGVTGYCNDQKAFIFVNLQKKFVTTLYFTDGVLIPGLPKGHWHGSGDNAGSKPYNITATENVEMAVCYACAAYDIAARFLSKAKQYKEGSFSFPEEVDETDVIYEGAVKQVLVNAYERNTQARRECIVHYGTRCVVCDFDFATVYGEAGKDYIHVHHLRQLSEMGERYKIKPIRDLRPVCPNCHAIIHRRKPAFSIEEVKVFLQQAKIQ